IEERAAAGGIVERPAERMLHQPRLVLARRYLPELLQPEPEFLRLAALCKAILRDQHFRQAAARAFGEQRVLRPQLHAAGEIAARLAVLANAHVTGGDA